MHRKLNDFLAGFSRVLDGSAAKDWSPDKRAILRMDRLEALSGMRLVPMASGVLASLIAWWSLVGLVDAGLLAGWLAAMLLIVVVDIVTGPPLRGFRPAKHELGKYYWQSVILCLLKGAAWGALVVMIYRDAGPEGQNVITVLVIALLASAPFVLAALPAAVFAFAGPLAAQAFAVFALSGLREHAFELLLLVLYAVAFPLALRRHSKGFAERSMALIKVDEQKRLITLLLNDFETHSGDWLWQTDAELRIRRVSDAFVKQSGIRFEELSGVRVDEFIASRLSGDPEQDAGAMRVRAHFAAREPFRELELYLRIGQEDHWWCVTGTPTYDRQGAFVGYRGIGREITDRKRAERELTYLAHHDTLTGVANRASFNKRLEEVRQGLAENRRFAVMLFDLDDFKVVNDTAGHAVGDEVLRTACRRIGAALPSRTFLARVGGDEFAAILELRPDMGVEEARDLANRLIAEVGQPILLPEGTFRIGISAGVAVMPDDGMDPAAVVQLADAALYSAKGNGKQGANSAGPAEGAARSQRGLLELDLRRALVEDQLQLVFQPIVDSKSDRTIAFEALARWQHPVFGDVSPASFIPAAERGDLIHQIGRWAIEQACRSAANWPEPIRVAVNISPRQFERDELVDVVAAALREGRLAPHRLEIELTESIYLGGIDLVRRTVSRLRELGVTITMDDFGTGYSSLSSLQDVTFDRLKIDQSLARRRIADKRTTNLLRSIVAIGEVLGLEVTAEGVETAEQAVFLRELGCGSLQGYFFGAPMSLAEIPAYLLAEARGGSRFDGMQPQGRTAAA